MEIKSYNIHYLEDVSESMGAMFEYAVTFGYEPKLFWQCFISSTVANQIAKGNIRYLTGYSGLDYIDLIVDDNPILKEKTKKSIDSIDMLLTFNKYYWSGWAIAHLQHETDLSFYQIDQLLPIDRVLELYYPLHEADISKFLDVAKTYIVRDKDTNLKKIRTAMGLSQHKLAELANVDFRSIQMYEQRQNDINKAQVETLYKISKILACRIEDLLEKY